METGLTKNRILSELSKSPHGKLQEYVAIGQEAAKQEPEFFAHLIAWDRIKGDVRDAKVALPVVALSVDQADVFVENSLAHIALLGPREFLKAYRFALELRPAGKMRKVRKIAECFLREIENDRRGFDRTALQHRKVLKELYALTHVKPSQRADAVLFKGIYPDGSVFAEVAKLKDMAPTEAAAIIMDRKIPFLVAKGALGAKAKDPDLVLALIKGMTATELVTNTKMLEKLGIKTNPALRGAYEEGLKKVTKSKANVLKTTRALEQIGDTDLRDKLRGVQEKQIEALGGVDGNWLVLADKSGSMNQAIEVSRHVSATLAKMVKGKVYLVFFDTMPMSIDVTGAALDMIKKATQHIQAGGGTSIGCGLQRMLEAKAEIDGIAIISDGGENTPPAFADVYKKYSTFAGKEVPVYLYHCVGENNVLEGNNRRSGVDMHTFELAGSSIDYYSIPNLVKTMRTNRYSLVDEVMAVPLVTLDKVFKHFDRKEVLHVASV